MFKGRRDTECEGKELELKETKKMIFCHGSFVRVSTLFLTEVERTLSRPLLLAWVFLWPLGGAIVSQWNGGLRSSPEKPPKFILPKNSQHTQCWTLNTSERLHKKQKKLCCFICDALLLSRLWCYIAKAPFCKHECAHYVQIALAHSNSLNAECSRWIHGTPGMKKTGRK